MTSRRLRTRIRLHELVRFSNPKPLVKIMSPFPWATPARATNKPGNAWTAPLLVRPGLKEHHFFRCDEQRPHRRGRGEKLYRSFYMR